MPAYTYQERFEIACQELRPLEQSLRKMGFKFETIVSQEILDAALYGIAIPTIIRFLKENDLSHFAMDLGASLLLGKCPELKKAWPDIAELYRNAPVGYGPLVEGDTKVLLFNAKSTLANALLKAYSAKRIPDVLALVQDRNLGETRLLLLRLLKRQRHKKNVAAVLDDLAEDPLLGDEIMKWAR